MPLLNAALSRRSIIATGLVAPFLPSLVSAAPRSLNFAVFRNGTKIGEHQVAFEGDGAALTATTEAVMTVKLGPAPVFRYRHRAVEHRTNGVFASLEADTTSNGRTERVVAERSAGGIRIERPSGAATLSPDANPMNHWDAQIFSGPLFNPQTGKLMKVRSAKTGPGHWSIRGEVEIDDYYDETGAWQSLTGKLDDGSQVEYRRV